MPKVILFLFIKKLYLCFPFEFLKISFKKHGIQIPSPPSLQISSSSNSDAHFSPTALVNSVGGEDSSEARRILFPGFLALADGHTAAVQSDKAILALAPRFAHTIAVLIFPAFLRFWHFHRREAISAQVAQFGALVVLLVGAFLEAQGGIKTTFKLN